MRVQDEEIKRGDADADVWVKDKNFRCEKHQYHAVGNHNVFTADM